MIFQREVPLDSVFLVFAASKIMVSDIFFVGQTHAHPPVFMVLFGNITISE